MSENNSMSMSEILSHSEEEQMNEMEVVNVRLPRFVKLLLDSMCYKEVENVKIKTQDRSDIMRSLVLEALIARGILQGTERKR